MAKQNIIVYNGAIAWLDSFIMDAQTMRIHEKQDAENITAYPNGDDDPTDYGIWLGNGTPMQDITLTGFPFTGGGTPLGFGNMSLGNNDEAATGGAMTFTIDTGCTIAGSYIVDDISMDHSRIVAGAKTTMSLRNSSDVTTTWAT